MQAPGNFFNNSFTCRRNFCFSEDFVMFCQIGQLAKLLEQRLEAKSKQRVKRVELKSKAGNVEFRFFNISTPLYIDQTASPPTPGWSFRGHKTASTEFFSRARHAIEVSNFQVIICLIVPSVVPTSFSVSFDAILISYGGHAPFMSISWLTDGVGAGTAQKRHPKPP